MLARWKQPHGGYISPAAFIPLAEKSGLIVPLTQSLMNQVARQMNAIASKLPEGFHIGINFSASHIISPTFVDECLNYRDSFTRRDLNLVLEVTEREPLNVDESLLDIKDIAHALSLICRGNGHVQYFYSVAQHSLACSAVEHSA